MKSVNSAVPSAIRSGYDIAAVPRLTVEWNLNRYSSVVEADNTPSDDTDGYDIEMFPIESIFESNRPTAGIMKARVGEARVADPYSQYDGTTRAARYYLGNIDDSYKYWTSPVPTNGTGVFPLHTDSITMVRPRVEYPNGVSANRIVVGLEDTWAKPKDFTIWVKTTPTGPYATVSTSPVINTKGQVILNYDPVAAQKWFTGNTATNDPASCQIIYGIEVRVDSLEGVTGGSPDGANSFFSLIEISARRFHDLTDRLVSVNDTFDLGDKSLVYPLGTVTSNTASVTLFNGDGVLNKENPDSPFADLMEPNALFNLEYVYTVGTNNYSVQQFKMYGGPWKGQRADSVTVECSDYSKYFQEIKPRATAYENLSAAEIVWRVCDSVGFVDYEIQTNDLTTNHKIPIWWCDGEQTVWEIFAELSKATQTAIYFDGSSKLQVRTREAAFDSSASPVWTLRGEDAGTELADIISLDQTDELEANFIKVSYSQTDIDEIVNGQSKTQVLWEPEGTVALRACPLYKSLGTSDTFISLPPQEAKIWPFDGMVNIEGELVKFEGKNFIYYEDGTRKSAVVKSQDEMEKFNNLTPFEGRYQNRYTGELKITERGVWNSEVKTHDVEADGYSVRSVVNGNRDAGVGGFSLRKAESRAYLNPGPRFKDSDDLLLATRGSETDTGFYFYGIKMRFEKGGGKSQSAGIVIHNNTNNEDGYFVELVPSAKLDTGKQRAKRNELRFYTRNAGKWNPHGKGTALSIIEGVDYEIDVQYKAEGSDHKIMVWVNGRQCHTETITGADKNPFGGKFGLFSRGDTKASFEYLYAIRREEEIDPSDDFSFLNKVEGGYTGGQLDREWVYRWRTERRRVKKKWTKVKSRYNLTFYDEFGPIVHEIREFNVDFDPKPAIASRLYMGNDYSVICPEYRADSFSARFYVANTSRATAIAHGEDTLTYAGSTASINPIMSIIGRTINVADAETVEAKNEDQIRMRGEIEVEISSQWIQTKALATDLAEWIKTHWSKGADEQSVSIFGNPLIELGDVVAVEYAGMDMTATTHKYFVTGIETSFDTGLETSLTLRRVSV